MMQHIEIDNSLGLLSTDVLDVLAKRDIPIRSLQLTGLKIDNRWLQRLSTFKSLEGLRILYTSVDAQGIEQLGNVTSLRNLAIAYCPNMESDQLSFTGLQQLKELHLVGEQWKDSVLRQLDSSGIRRLLVGFTVLV